MDLAIVLVTCGSEEEAGKISELLVRQHMAACVSITPVRSVFEWQGKFENQSEWLLMIKTLSPLLARVEEAVKANHSYECPEIIALNVAAVSENYARWVRSVCKTP